MEKSFEELKKIKLEYKDRFFIEKLALGNEDGVKQIYSANDISEKTFNLAMSNVQFLSKVIELTVIISGLYFQPPTTTNNSQKIIKLIIKPIGICVYFDV